MLIHSRLNLWSVSFNYLSLIYTTLIIKYPSCHTLSSLKINSHNHTEFFRKINILIIWFQHKRYHTFVHGSQTLA